MDDLPYKGLQQPVRPRIPYEIRHPSSPGPGQYEVLPGIGKFQILSPRKSRPSYTINLEKRDAYLKTYLSSSLQAKTPQILTNRCDLIDKPVIGRRMFTSAIKNSPSYGFGTGVRGGRILYSASLPSNEYVNATYRSAIKSVPRPRK